MKSDSSVEDLPFSEVPTDSHNHLTKMAHDLLPLVPVGVVVTIFLFWLRERNSKKDRCKDIVSKDLGEFLAEQEKTYALIREHQGGKPSGTAKTLTASREDISTKLKALTSMRERISPQLMGHSADKWLNCHLYWKEAMQGDTGLITQKGAVCPLRLLKMEAAQKTYQEYLVALRQNISRGAEKVTQLTLPH